MPLRPISISAPPPSGNASFDVWVREVASVLNGLPISVFSTANGPNASRVTAPRGYFGIEIASSTTTRFWVKTGASHSTGWSAISYI